MKKVASTFLVVCIVFVAKQSMSLEKGKWSFVKDNDWCYIGSSPIESDLPETKKEVKTISLFIKLLVVRKILFRLRQDISIT